MMLPCVLLFATFVAHCQATITVFKPKTNDEWKYDDSKYVSHARTKACSATRTRRRLREFFFALLLRASRVLCGDVTPCMASRRLAPWTHVLLTHRFVGAPFRRVSATPRHVTRRDLLFTCAFLTRAQRPTVGPRCSMDVGPRQRDARNNRTLGRSVVWCRHETGDIDERFGHVKRQRTRAGRRSCWHLRCAAALAHVHAPTRPMPSTSCRLALNCRISRASQSRTSTSMFRVAAFCARATR